MSPDTNERRSQAACADPHPIVPYMPGVPVAHPGCPAAHIQVSQPDDHPGTYKARFIGYTLYIFG